MLVVLSLFAAAAAGGLAALTIAPPVGIAVAIVAIGAGIAAQATDGPPRQAIGLTLLATVVLAGSYLAITAIDLVQTMTRTEGSVPTAEPASLDAATAKIEGLDGPGAFRLELTEPELQAVIQEGIARNPDLPISRLDLDLREATQDVAYEASFKATPMTAQGTAEVVLDAGGISLELGTLDFGPVAVPGVAGDAIQSVLGGMTDLNAALESQGTVVQDIWVAEDRLVVIGTRAGEPLTGGQLLAAIREQAAGGTEQVATPAEVVGPGTINAREAPGQPLVLALGDSLAAGVGVDELRDGYVSRFHHAVSQADGVDYGLQNLGVSGETSASMLSSGQLDRAEQILLSQSAGYITVDIGANDLFGHLQSPDCGGDLTAPACQDRVNRTLDAYRVNVTAMLDRLTRVSGEAQVILLQIYNPFSLGLGATEQGQQSSAVVARLNSVAAEVAAAHGVAVADGFTPLQQTTAVTTHMLDADPDIHPNALGHDLLAAALVAAVTQ